MDANGWISATVNKLSEETMRNCFVSVIHGVSSRLCKIGDEDGNRIHNYPVVRRERFGAG